MKLYMIRMRKCINVIQGDSGWRVNILESDSMGYCEEKVHMNVCLILIVSQDSVVWFQIQLS
jgi:hypothetical protein